MKLQLGFFAHWLLVRLGQRETLVPDQRLKTDPEVFISLTHPLLGPQIASGWFLFGRPQVLAGCPPLQLQLWVLVTTSSPIPLSEWWWLKLPSVVKAGMLHHALSASLNSVHTFVKGPLINLSSIALSECAICLLSGC